MDKKSSVEPDQARAVEPAPSRSPGEKSPASTRDLDDAYELYRQQDAQDLDPQEARQVLRRIDWHLLPLLMGTYMLQYLDKSSINFASVFGLQKGTHLQGQEWYVSRNVIVCPGTAGYILETWTKSTNMTPFHTIDSWLSSIFYIGYLVAQPLAGFLLQRLPVGKFIGSTALGNLVWGMLTITTPACTNFAGIAANRFLLGCFEAVVNPGFVLVLSMWYRQDEQPMRMVTYYCMNGVAGIFGGLLGYAIGHITSGLQPWQYIFIIFGSISLAWGIVFLIFMPDLPTTARYLNGRQRIVAVERVTMNRQGVKNHHYKAYQLRQCLLDPKTWILFIMSVAAQIPNAAQSTFTSIILETFGFDVLQAQYMQIPGNVIQIGSLLASGWISSRFPNMRCAVMLVSNLICVGAGAALVGSPPGPDGTDNKWGRLVALWLCSFTSVGFSMSLTMVSSNVAGYTKKQVTGAILFIGYCVGNVRVNALWRFRILIGYTAKTVMVIVLYMYMWSVNKKRDREASITGSHLTEEQEKEAIEKGMLDMTELDNKGFRYVL
ncbi:Uu.00g079810.m01.CDS01 [Anthostomella pinea]|uniref:Uu.00g079810.m01.CDS01 n=1 Tax=Anthostomella pinea TaxID=933095 RepID=A0AAI8YJ90_9PEZI|nr:Uu.00g079810.m01.CDS01 [Anthostomella pinea]